MAKFNFYIFIISVFALTSCGHRHKGEEKPTLFSNALSITDNEDKGVKEILGFYGGYYKYAGGYSASTSEGKKKYFELELSKSGTMEKYAKIVEMPASNIAYLFYQNLKEEQNNYDEIHVVIIFKDGGKKNYSYTKDELATVVKKMPVAENIANLLKDKNFQGVKPLLKPDTSFIRYDKDVLVANLAKVDPQFGTIEKFLPYGFHFIRRKDGKQPLLHISGVLVRDNQSNEFSIDVDPASTTNEILLLQYEL